MRSYAQEQDITFFIDPPYTAAAKKAGARLYSHFELDQHELFRTCQVLAGDILLTYENSDGTRAMAEQYGFAYKPVAMSNTHYAKMNELLIGKDLDWTT